MKVWIVWCSDEYGNQNVQKVFDDKQKAKDFIEFKPQMTGENWGYFDTNVE